MRAPFARLVHTLAVSMCAVVLLASSAQAVNAVDMRADQLLAAANFVKESLALTPNQQTLWQQVTAKSAALVRARQQRGAKLQAELTAALEAGPGDLRELAAKVASESASSAAEEGQLRELWLTVSDALDDRQRGIAQKFLLSQLMRVEAPDRPARAEREHEQGRPSGGGRHKGGGESSPRF